LPTGHAAATAHAAGYAPGAAIYAVKGAAAAGPGAPDAAAAERGWQHGRAPRRLRSVTLPKNRVWKCREL